MPSRWREIFNMMGTIFKFKSKIIVPSLFFNALPADYIVFTVLEAALMGAYLVSCLAAEARMA
jgi:hypothetical protein